MFSYGFCRHGSAASGAGGGPASWNDERGRQAGAGAGPQGALLSQQRDGRKRGRQHALLIIRYRCFQKLGELEKNGNCSSPRRGRRWHGVARRGKPTRTAQHNMRDPFVYLFVNEGNETGNLIFGLCFPMASLAVDGQHLEMGEGGDDGGQARYRKARACGRAGCPHATAGSAGKVLRHVTTATLFCFGNFMKKEGRSGTAGGGDSWRALLSRPVAADKLGRRRR